MIGKSHRPILISVLLLMSWSGTPAHAADIEGLWLQVDDKSGRPNSLVRIETVAGEIGATIVKGYSTPEKAREPNARCERCPGDFLDQPLIGLKFLWGLTGSGREWGGGRILDPDEGQIYRAKATLSEDGQALTVRGYVGVSLFGRSQVWRRHSGQID